MRATRPSLLPSPLAPRGNSSRLDRLRTQPSAISPRAAALSAALAFSSTAHAAAGDVLNAFGQSGGLVIPYGFTLPQGAFEGQYNNYLDPRYERAATGSQVYWGGVGLLPCVEVSAGLADYPANVPPALFGSERFLLRHLMGNVKAEVPQFFSWQPAIAFGVSDTGGQTHFFRSTYGVVSQTFGPATLTLGYGHGDRLNGVFGGAAFDLGRTGLSLLAEDDAKTPYLGVRYTSPAIHWLADASVVGTAMRAMRSTDGSAPRVAFSVGIRIPLGRRFDATRCAHGLCAIDGQTALREPTAWRSPAAEQMAAATLPASLAEGLAAPQTSAAAPEIAPVDLDTSPLDAIFRHLVDAGLERVRVGLIGHELIVEYENHRYGQNEADALGIVLGVASEQAPAGVEVIRTVIEKAGEPLGEVSVARAAYVRFLDGGSSAGASASLTMRMSPTHDERSVMWYGNAHYHALTRIETAPVASYLYGTEYGNFDVSVGANIQAFVPLWKGAELYSSVIAPIANTRNMDPGQVFSPYRLRGGLATVALAQSFWIAPRIFNVASIGKFNFHYVGLENETIAFVPGRDDLVRLRLDYLRHQPGDAVLPDEKNALFAYRWVQPAWHLWVEAGVARFVGGDTGPLLTLTRWFDDVSFSVFGEHSGRGSFVGASVSFPITPRQGMRPGFTQVTGTSGFPLNFRTQVHGTNFIADNGAENLSPAYDVERLLLNSDRFGPGYFSTQLYRMRDAYLRYAQPTHDSRGGAMTPQPTVSPSTPPASQVVPTVCETGSSALADGGRFVTTHCQ